MLARIVDAFVFAAIGNAYLLSLLPTMVTLVIESFRGWPFILIAYLSITAVFYFQSAELAGEATYWRTLRQVDFLLGVNCWLAAFAITRGLLEVCTQSLWLNLKDGHFKERVQSALLSMRCMRLLFGTGRAARAKAAARMHAQPAAPQGRRGVARAIAGTVGSGVKALGSGVDALSAVIRRRNRQMDPARKPASAEPAVRPLHKQAPAKSAELYIVEDTLFSASTSLTALSDQVELLVSALAKRGGFVKSAHDARRRAANCFDALLTEYEWELETSRATGEAPPVDGDGPPGTIPRARLIRWCLLATRKRGASFGRKLNSRMEAVFPATVVSRSDVRTAALRCRATLPKPILCGG